jgi:hypothetical protein
MFGGGDVEDGCRVKRGNGLRMSWQVYHILYKFVFYTFHILFDPPSLDSSDTFSRLYIAFEVI